MKKNFVIAHRLGSYFGEILDLQIFIPSLFAFALLLVSSAAFSALPTMIKIDGSSTVFPISEAAAEDFQAQKDNKVKVTVGISGTGGGFKKFCRNETDIQNASRPILGMELKDCKAANVKFFETPIAYDAMVIVVNPKTKWISEITIDELKVMWEASAQGKIQNWNQINPKYPDVPLKLFGAGADSGTFDYFTEAIVGKAKSSRGDYTASEDDNTLVSGVSRQEGSLGFIPLSYYEENKDKLKALAVVGGPNSPMKTKAILPSAQTVIDGSYYPLSRPIFIYINQNAYSRVEVKDFVSFYLKNGLRLVKQVKYIPLPEKSYEIGLKNVQAGKVGTVFDGHSAIGLKVEDLLKKESKL